MGNTLLDTKGKENPLKGFEIWMEQYNELSNKKTLFENKIFKTFQFHIKSSSPNLIIKIYQLEKQSIDLLPYQKNFSYIQKQLNPRIFTNVMPFQRTVNFENTRKQKEEGGFVGVIRQCTHTTLHDRFVSPQQITLDEKLWILTQTMVGLVNIHGARLFHGNLRSSNILMNSSNYVFIADFACYKPLYINQDQLSEFRLFYLSSITNCCLAPEKFRLKEEIQGQDSSYQIQDMIDQTLIKLQMMDMFSLGCVVAQTFCNGQPLFTYQEILQYRKGLIDVTDRIKKIGDPQIEHFCSILISTDPKSRMTAQQAFMFWNQHIINRSKISSLYYLESTLNSFEFSSPDHRLALISQIFPTMITRILGFENLAYDNKFYLPIQLQFTDLFHVFQTVVERISTKEFIKYFPVGKEWCELFESNRIHKTAQEVFKMENLEKFQNLQCHPFKQQYEQFISQNFQASSDPENEERKESKKSHQPSFNEEEFLKCMESLDQDISSKIIVRVLVKSIAGNIRSCRFVPSKLIGLNMMKFLMNLLNDHDILYFFLPYIAAFFDDPDSTVQCQSFEIFCSALTKMKKPFNNVGDTVLLQVFIWENICKISRSEDLNLLKLFYSKIKQWAFAIQHLLITAIALRKDQQMMSQGSKSTSEQILIQDVSSESEKLVLEPKLNIFGDDEKANWEQQIKHIRQFVNEILKNNLFTEIQNLEIAEILISNLHQVASFLSNDALDQIPLMMISLLNQHELKLICLQQFTQFVKVISQKNNPNHLLPIIEDCLYQVNQLEVMHAVQLIREMMLLNYLGYKTEYEYIDKIGPLLVHPHLWVRVQAISFFEDLISKYPALDIYINFNHKISTYLNESVPMLNLEIFRILVPQPLTIKVDFKNQTIDGDPQYRRLFDQFKDRYLTKVQPAKDFSVQKEQRNDAAIFKNLTQQKFYKNSNEFISHIFKNFYGFWFVQDDVNCEKFRNDLNQLSLQKQNDVYDLQLDENLNQYIWKKLHFSIQNSEKNKIITLPKYEYFERLFQEIYKKDYIYQKFNLHNILHYRNFLSIMSNVNSIIFRANQFQIQQDIDLGKPMLSSNPGFNLLKSSKPNGNLITTIYQHNDSVNCLELLRDNRHFISGSNDGHVRIFDLNTIENDITMESISFIKVDMEQKKQPNIPKIKSIKFIEDTSSLLVGTDRGVIFLYRFETQGNDKFAKQTKLKSFVVDGEIVQLDTLKNENHEHCFIYVTMKGELGIQELRTKSKTQYYQIGKERGIISSMVLNNKSTQVFIGTFNGYCLVYDIRYNLISNIFQLISWQKVPQPILSLTNFYQFSNIGGGDSTQMVAISFCSNHHEIAIFDLNEAHNSNSEKQCSIYLVSTKQEEEDFRMPTLKNLNNNEEFTNLDYSLSQMMHYDFIPHFSNKVDVLSYLNDPMINKQNSVKQAWLDRSKHSYTNISSVFNYNNNVHKILCYPSFNPSLLPNSVSIKNVENFFVTVGNDQNIRYFPLVSENPKEPNTIKKYVKGYHINNVDGENRCFAQIQTDAGTIIHQFEKINNSQKTSQVETVGPSFTKIDKRCSHTDVINDVLVVQRNGQYLYITASRDKTIKIWK